MSTSAQAAPSVIAGQRVGYVRVSSVDQNTERQLDGIALDMTFTDKASGKDTDRPQLQAAMTHLRAGDTFIIHSMDRLSRCMEDMLRVVRELKAKGVTVQFIKEKMTFDATGTRPQDELMFTMLGAFAQFERAIIGERQREGIALAKAKGDVYKGRKPSLTSEQAKELRAKAAAGAKKTVLAKEYGISRETLYSYLKQSA
jgi:DNA invertase Pin-like site-specific DNA recombinase